MCLSDKLFSRIGVMVTTIDFLSGAVTAQLKAALQQAPLVQPVHLTDHVPATFEGYTPTDLTVQNQAPIVPGWGYLQASATFSYLGDASFVDVTSLWIFAIYVRAYYLVRVIPLTGTPAARLRYGRTRINFEVVGHAIPVG
jgi:hypothetical protein